MCVGVGLWGGGACTNSYTRLNTVYCNVFVPWFKDYNQTMCFAIYLRDCPPIPVNMPVVYHICLSKFVFKHGLSCSKDYAKIAKFRGYWEFVQI